MNSVLIPILEDSSPYRGGCRVSCITNGKKQKGQACQVQERLLVYS